MRRMGRSRYSSDCRPEAPSISLRGSWASSLQGSLGQPVVVENKPGASTRIAVQALKSSEPNGQTLLVAPDAIVTLFPHVFKKVGYDPFKDLTPISQILYWSYGFAVPEASPAKTFAEFVTLAKADPKFAFFASPSTGSGQHILGLQLGDLIGVKLDHVPFKGAADAMNALLSNSVPSSILTLGELTNLHQSGKVRILATLTATRTADLPEVPTFTEIGYPQMQAYGCGRDVRAGRNGSCAHRTHQQGCAGRARRSGGQGQDSKDGHGGQKQYAAGTRRLRSVRTRALGHCRQGVTTTFLSDLRIFTS